MRTSLWIDFFISSDATSREHSAELAVQSESPRLRANRGNSTVVAIYACVPKGIIK